MVESTESPWAYSAEAVGEPGWHWRGEVEAAAQHSVQTGRQERDGR